MILLDTNVVSETLRVTPNPKLVAWLDAQRPALIYVCAPVLAELYRGIARLPESRRKDHLSVAIERMQNELFRNRILAFDIGAAKQYGDLSAIRERLGQPIGHMDAMIAAIALCHRATVATRDIRDFAGLGLELINPFEWTAAAR